MAVRTISLVAIFFFSVLVHGLPPPELKRRATAVLPVDDPFYVPPDGFESKAPGTILRHRKTPAPISNFGFDPINIDGAYHILYRSADNFGNPVATVTTVMVPHDADFGKLLSYQVAEDAASPNCAPSYALQQFSETGGFMGTSVTQAELILMTAALQNGWVVTVPDFEGPTAAYLANKRAGYAVLDGIRATLASADITGVSSDARVTMWGYSGGSLASGFAAELQPSYAPELDIAGAAIGGTVPDIGSALESLNATPNAGLIPAGMLGLAHEYPEIQKLLDEQLVADKKDKFMKAAVECYSADKREFKNEDIYTYMKDSSILTSDPVVRVEEENDMGQHTPKIPLLVYKAVKDEISVVNDTTQLVKKYCASGASVDYRMSKTGKHTDLAITGAPSALLWLKDRMNSIPQEGCKTSTEFTALEDPKAFLVLSKTLINLILDLLGKPIA